MAEPHRTRDLRDYWAVLARRRGVIALCVAAVTLATLVGSFLVTPLYRSTATVQIERQSPDILNVRELGSLDYSFAAYADFYQTQYRILSSDAVARKTVERLDLVSHPLFAVGEARPSLLARVRAMLPGTAAKLAADPEDGAAKQLLHRLEIAPIRNSHLVAVSWVAADPVLAADIA